MASDPVQDFNTFLSNHDFVMLVFYRGHWCPFCMVYLSELQSVTKSIESKGGGVMIVSAEDASMIPKVREGSGYTGEAISDPENLLATHLRDKGLLEVAISSKGGYPHGMAQPAVLVVQKDKSPLYQWAIIPSMINLGGAKDRPSLEQIWDNVQAKMESRDVVHKTIKKLTMWEVMSKKIFG